MAFWEFLIQKEGDRSWLPLESPSVEILEGRYRVVARSSRVSTTTEIRVTHQDLDASPPVRRIRKRTSQTNPDGLIVILPFTQLSPGAWELHCTSDLMAEMLGEGWQSTVQLDVLPLESSRGEEWDDEPDSRIETASDTALSEDSPAGAPPAAMPLMEPPVEPAMEPREEPADAAPVTNGGQTAAVVSAEASPPTLSGVDLLLDPALAAPPTKQEQPAQPEAFVPVSEAAAAMSAEAAEPAAIDLSATEQAAESPGQPSAPLRVVLDHETFVIQRGETLILTGRVEPGAPEESATLVPITELRVRLFDPQTSHLLMDESYPVGGRLPPFPFSGTVSLPEHYQTYLVLGEILFKGVTAAGVPVVVATQSFNVTTDLHELIEAIANDFPDEADALPPEAVLPPTQVPRSKTSTPSSLSSLPLFSPASRQPLPPQLRPATGVRTERTTIQLPTFLTPIPSTPNPQSPPQARSADVRSTEAGSTEASERPTEAVPPAVLTEEVATEPRTEATLAPVNRHPAATDATQPPPPAPGSETAAAAEVSEAASNIAAATPQPPSPISSGGSAKPVGAVPPSPIPPPIDLLWDWDDAGQRVPAWRQASETPEAATPEESSFRALNLKNRFWSRLQALVADAELSSWLESQPLVDDGTATADSLLPPGAPPLVRSRSHRDQPLGLDARLAAQEIVVEDDPANTEGTSRPSEEATERLPVLAEDMPVPVPRIQVPQSELVAGQPLVLTIKLPNTPSRLRVKLWLRDRQTRSLLGSPCWLSDFTPDGLGSLVVHHDLTIPEGCLEVQFEAITIEVVSQRESDKATLTRPVVPPDLSTLSFNELEI